MPRNACCVGHDGPDLDWSSDKDGEDGLRPCPAHAGGDATTVGFGGSAVSLVTCAGDAAFSSKTQLWVRLLSPTAPALLRLPLEGPMRTMATQISGMAHPTQPPLTTTAPQLLPLLPSPLTLLPFSPPGPPTADGVGGGGLLLL